MPNLLPGVPATKLQEMACVGKGIFQTVPDRSSTDDFSMEKAEYNLLQAYTCYYMDEWPKHTALCL